MIPFPDKKYDIIYADPPWKYDGHMLETLEHDGAPYETLPFAAVSLLPIHKIANDNCLLFMWAISPSLPEAIVVGSAWGFDYITVAFVWDKQRTVCGNYTLSQCELCLVFRRGKIPQPRGKRNVKQFLSSLRGEHSEKPKEIRHRITEMFPTQSKIELFARPDWTDYDRGWDFWGNEV